MAIPKRNEDGENKDTEQDKRDLSAIKKRSDIPTLSNNASNKKTDKTPFSTKQKKNSSKKNKSKDKEKKKISPMIWIPTAAVLSVGAIISGVFYFNAEEPEVIEKKESGDTNVANWENEDEGGNMDSSSPVELADYQSNPWQESVGEDLTKWQNYTDTQTDEDFELPEGLVGDGSGMDDDPGEDWDGTGHSVDWNSEKNRPATPWDDDPESAPDGILARQHIEDLMRENSDIRSAANKFPSRASGYTNNLNQEKLEDGSDNPAYSFLLSEDVEFFFGHSVERLINPLYGEWTNLTLDLDNKNERTAKLTFDDMFSVDWFNDNISDDDISALPILGNWDNQSVDKFGREWYGEIKNVDITFEDDSDRFTTDIKVEYQRYTDDGDTEKKNGTLTLTAHPNYEDPDDINNRYVIVESKLSMDS